jgi:membrane-associated phospholipid phosphatase
LLLAVTTAFLASDFELKGKEWTWASILITLQVLVGMCLRGRGFAALGTAIEAPALLSAVCLTILLATFFLGANQRPLIDSSLARADELLFLGFQWPTAMIAFFEQRTLAALANFAYGTLDWQPGMLLLLLCARGAPERCWTFLFAWIVTLIIVVGIYAFAPGVGGYAFHGITAAEVPGATDPTAWRYPEILRSLRSGHLRQIDFDTMEGLVTFPSFHAGAAVLLGWGFWTLRWLRWPFAILNIAMFLSAVPIGGHYLVDLLAGGAVAAIGISMAKCLSARTEGRTFVVPGGVGQFACSGPITGKGSGAT